MTTAERKTSDERKALLGQAVSNAVRQGARVEGQSDYQSITVQGKPVNHILHLILTLVTFGLWAIIWIILVLTGGEKRRTITVDEWGNVNTQ